jgi:hypothetical protein
MSETLILPASVILVAAVCAIFFVEPSHLRGGADGGASAGAPGAAPAGAPAAPQPAVD